MRILMLNPPFWKGKISRSSRWPEVTKSGTLYYPFWLSYATGLLEANDFKVRLIDAPSKNLSIDSVRDFAVRWNPRLVVIETSTPSIYNDLKIASILKYELPDSLITLVGPHVSALPGQTLRASRSVDLIARKEYDDTLLELAQKVEMNENIRSVLGVSYRQGDKVKHNPDRPFRENLDELPFVSKIYKKHLDVRDYFYAMILYPMVQIMSGRGCPFRCSFCVWPQAFMGRRYRVRSAQNIVNEFEYIKQNMHEVKEVFIEDDTFTANRKNVERICGFIQEKRLDITWSANVRANLDYTLLNKIKKANCRLLVVGYESGSQQLLNNVKKEITLQQARDFAKNCKKVGILTLGCFMIGLPGENEQTITQTIRFARELRPDVAFFQIATPFPGTEFYEWAEKNNYIVTHDFSKWVDERGVLRAVISYPNLTGGELERIAEKATFEYHFNPSYISSTFMLVLRRPKEIERILKGFKSLLRHHSAHTIRP